MKKKDTLKYEEPLKLDMGFEEALQRFSRVNTKDTTDVPEEKPEGNKATPFLKWVGGKRSIIEELKARLPDEFNDYYEGFVGGGALYFELQPTLKKAFLSDANLDLVLTYSVIKMEQLKLLKIKVRRRT